MAPLLFKLPRPRSRSRLLAPASTLADRALQAPSLAVRSEPTAGRASQLHCWPPTASPRGIDRRAPTMRLSLRPCRCARHSTSLSPTDPADTLPPAISCAGSYLRLLTNKDLTFDSPTSTSRHGMLARPCARLIPCLTLLAICVGKPLRVSDRPRRAQVNAERRSDPPPPTSFRRLEKGRAPSPWTR